MEALEPRQMLTGVVASSSEIYFTGDSAVQTADSDGNPTGDLSAASNGNFYQEGLQPGTPYYYLETDQNNNVNFVQFTTFGGADEPQNLHITHLKPGGVELTWSAVSGAVDYRVQRSVDGSDYRTPPDNYQTIAPTTNGAATFTDTTATGGHRYDYRVVAVHSSGPTSDPSDFADAYVAPAVNTLISNGSFEDPSLDDGTSCQAPANSTWSYTGSVNLAGAGVTHNAPDFFANSGQGSPDGSQHAYVQSYGMISQTGFLPAGHYRITFKAAQRINYWFTQNPQTFWFDGWNLATFTPGSSWASYTLDTTIPDTNNGIHTLQITGLDPRGGDSTALIDDLKIVSTDVAQPGLTIDGGTSLDEGSSTMLTAAHATASESQLNGVVWTVTQGGKTVTSGTGSQFVFKPTATGEFIVTALLAGLNQSTSEVLTVRNEPPADVQIVAPNKQQYSNHTIILGSRASDSGGPTDKLAYSWTVTKDRATGETTDWSLPAGTVTNLPALAFTPDVAGTFHATLTVTDGGGAATSATQTITVLEGASPSAWLGNTITTTPSDIWGWADMNVVQQPDGKLLLVGLQSEGSVTYADYPQALFLARLTPDLNLDTSFGDTIQGSSARTGWTETGLVIPHTGTTQIAHHPRPALALLDNGQIIVGGSTFFSSTMPVAALRRFNANGTVDSTFNQNDTNTAHRGYALTDFGAVGGRFDAVTYVPPSSPGGQGHLLATGAAQPVAFIQPADLSHAPISSFGIARFNLDGTLDTSFRSNGSFSDQMTNTSDVLRNDNYSLESHFVESASSIILRPDGSFLVGGQTWKDAGGAESEWGGNAIAIASYNADGTTDTGFAGGVGKVLMQVPFANGGSGTTHSGDSTNLMRLLLQPDGKVLAIGEADFGSGGDDRGFVVRLNKNGSVDLPYGGADNGAAVLADVPQHGFEGLTVDGSFDKMGKLVLATGDYFAEYDAGPTIFRLTAEGLPDGTFGTDGMVPVPGDLNQFDARAAVVGSDGAMYVFGATGTAQSAVHAVRYKPVIAAAADLVATARPDGPIDLNWIDAGTYEEGFGVERSTSATGGFHLIASVGPGVTTYQDQDVEPSTTYYYRVFPYPDSDPNDRPGQSNVAHATTVGLHVRYRLVETVPVPVDGSAINSTTSLAAGQQYLLRATGNIQIKGDQSASGGPGAYRADAEYGHFDPLPMNNSDWVGHGLVDYGIGVNDSSLGMTKFPYWGPPSGDDDNSYTIAFTPDATGPISLNFHDDYYPDNVADQSGHALQVQIYKAIPAVPAQLSAQGNRGNHTVTLTWQDAAATGLLTSIQRSSDGGTSWQTLTILPANATSYVDSVQLNTPYVYRVSTPDSEGQAVYSNEVSLALVNLPPTLSIASASALSPSYAVDVPIPAIDPDAAPSTSLTYTLLSGDGALSFAGGASSITTGSMPHLTGSYSAPSATDSPVHWYQVQVTDADGATATQWFAVTVYAPGEAPPPSAGAISANPQSVYGNSTVLTLHASNPGGGDDGIVYHWSAYGGNFVGDLNPHLQLTPPPSFSVNDSHDASSTTVTFASAGGYNFAVTATNSQGASVTRYISLTVNQTLSRLDVEPSGAVLPIDSQWEFKAFGIDQFGDPMDVPDGTAVNWSIAGSGSGNSINANAVVDGAADAIADLGAARGKYYTVTASVNTIVGTASGTQQVGIATGDNGLPTVAIQPMAQLIDPSASTSGVPVKLSVLGEDDGGESNLTYQWSLVSGPASVTFPSGSKNSYKNLIVTAPTAGTYTFRVKITDANLTYVTSDTASLVVPVANSTRVATSIQIDADGALLAAGGSRTFTAKVLDQYGTPLTSQPSVSWSVSGGNANGTITSGGVYTAPSALGQYNVVATSGSITRIALVNVVSLEPVAKITSLDVPDDPSMPLAQPGQNSSIDPGTVIDRDTPVRVIVAGPLPTHYTLKLHPLTGGAGPDIVLADASGPVGTLPDDGDIVATIHPTMLPPGAYQLMLDATSTTGSGNNAVTYPGSDTQTIVIESNFGSLGNLSLPITDLTLDAGAGQTISLTRVYDSARASQLGDFGYGWFLDSTAPAISTTALAGRHAENGIPALRYGDIVYVTLPGGARHAFAFTPRPLTNNYQPANAGLYTEFRPFFVPVDGSGASLSAAGANDTDSDSAYILLEDPDTGEYFGKTIVGGYNPARSGYGGQYVLTEPDGTAYHVDVSSGHNVVDTVTDANHNVTSIANLSADNARYHIIIHRDPSDTNSPKRILWVAASADPNETDSSNIPDSRKVIFGYDSRGQLTSITDRAGNTTTYGYLNTGTGSSTAYTHLLNQVVDPRHIVVLTAQYADTSSGQLTALKNTYTKSAGVDTGSFTGGSASQAVTDLAGGSTENVYDEHGNVTRTIQAVTGIDADTGQLVVQKYVVSVREYSYAAGNPGDPWADHAYTGGMLADVKSYQPFEIAGSDPDGHRYKDDPPASSLISEQSFNGDPAGAAADLTQLGSTTTIAADGSLRTTNFAGYQEGKPRKVIDADGNKSYSYYDSRGNLKWSINPLGEGTLYLYSHDVDPLSTANPPATLGDPSLPYGLLMETFPIKLNGDIDDPVDYADHNPGSNPFTRLSNTPLSSNTYYASADIPHGMLDGKLASSTDAAGKTTYYQYDANGDVTRTFWLWHNPLIGQSGQSNHWVVSTTYYDAAGRSVATADAVYADGGTAGTLELSGTSTSLDLNGNLTIAETPILAGPANTYRGLDLFGNAWTNNSAAAPQRLTSQTHYNSIGQPDWTADEYGGITRNTYDARSNLIRVLYPDGTETRSAFDDMGRQIWSTDRYASTTTFNASTGVWTNDNATTALATHTLYDSLGRTIGTERYQGVVIGINPDQSVTTSGTPTETIYGTTAPDPAALQAIKLLISTTATAYDAAGRESASAAADGSQTLTQYYPNGQVLRTRQVGAPGVAVAGPTDWTTQDSNRDELDVIKVAGSVTSGATFTVTLPTAGGGSDGVSVSYSAQVNTVALVLSALADAINADPNFAGAYRSDAADSYLVLRTASPTATFGATVSSNLSDVTHLASSSYEHLDHPSNSWTIDPLGHVSLSEHDAAANADTMTLFDDSVSPQGRVITRTITGIAGQPVPGHEPSSSNSAIAMPGQTIAAGGRQVTKIDAMGIATDYFYDASDRLTDVWQPYAPYLNTTVSGGGAAIQATSNTSGSARPHWHYGYDSDGNETSQTDAMLPTRRVTTFAYDDHDRRISHTLPQVGTAAAADEDWKYDALGRMLAHKDFKGQVAVESYDASPTYGGRLSAEYRFAGTESGLSFTNSTFPLSSAPEHSTFGYDNLGRLNLTTEFTGTSTSLTQSTSFDPITGGVSQTETKIAVNGTLTSLGIVNHAYDPATGRLLRTWAGAPDTSATENTRYVYDGLGRLNSVTSTAMAASTFAPTPLASYAYDADGDLASVTLANGVTTTYFYDGLNRLQKETVHYHSTSSDRDIAEYDYTTRADGQRTDVLEKTWNSAGTSFSQTKITYGYDDLDRLISETRDVGNNGLDSSDEKDTYAFDLANNRTRKQVDLGNDGSIDHTTYSAYDERDELTTETTDSTDTTTSSYDANGSLTSQTHGSSNQKYTYDKRNRLVGFDANGNNSLSDTGDVAYAYDPDGNRIAETTVGAASEYDLIDSANPTGYAQVLEESATPGGTPARGYLLGQDVIAQTAGGVLRYLSYDGHGNTRALLDSTGHVATGQIYAYDAFGNPIGFTPSTAATRLLYTGERYDAALGQYFWRVRPYSASDGRFMDADPSDRSGRTSDPMSLHNYVFANGDPTMLVDPTGLMSETEMKVVATIGAFLFTMTMHSAYSNAVKASRAYSSGRWLEGTNYFGRELVDLFSLGFGGKPGTSAPALQAATSAVQLAAVDLQVASAQAGQYLALFASRVINIGGGQKYVQRSGTPERTVEGPDGSDVPIIGQSGSTSGTAGHDEMIDAIAEREAQQPGRLAIFLQRSIRTATGRAVDVGQIPDVIVVRWRVPGDMTKGVAIDLYEVRSASQTPKAIAEKLQAMMSKIPEALQGDPVPVEPSEASK
jgi:RHS repeat-associated protein/uncharacterized delta-60 repeat protein